MCEENWVAVCVCMCVCVCVSACVGVRVGVCGCVHAIDESSQERRVG